jgi:hypothetical protein
MEYTREVPGAPSARRAHQRLVRNLPAVPGRKHRTQGARCMDCGVPFCHTGCPVNNIIPDWNDMVFRGRWREAIRVLHSTNNFPGIHGPHLPGALRSVLRARHQRARGDHQEHREDDRGPRLGGGLDRARTRREEDRQARGRRRVGTGRASPPRSNWRARGMPSLCSKSRIASAACFAMAFRTSRWRSI